MAKIKRLIIPGLGKDVGQLELSFIPDRNAKWYGHVGRKFDGLLIKPNMLLLGNQAIIFFGFTQRS